jgi:D-aspartate ligase
MLQEYVPREYGEDWIFHTYCDTSSNCKVLFTAVKLRSWPPHAGVTTYARTAYNAVLAEQASRLCRAINFVGIADLDWRLDRRDGHYKLVDFNPRVGAQFRLFENEAGIDVIRALHLDLTGRPVPDGRQIEGRRFIVENLDVPAVLAYRRTRPAKPSVEFERGRTELAWLALDDPVPFLAMAARFGRLAVAQLMGVDRWSGK